MDRTDMEEPRVGGRQRLEEIGSDEGRQAFPRRQEKSGSLDATLAVSLHVQHSTSRLAVPLRAANLRCKPHFSLSERPASY